MPFDYPGVFGASTDLQAPDFSGLIPRLAGPDAGAPAVPATLGGLSALANKAPVLDYEGFKKSRNFIDDINDHGLIPALFGSNDRTADYLKYLAGALGVSGAAQKNELGQYDVDYYRRQNAGMPTGARGAAGLVAGALSAPDNSGAGSVTGAPGVAVPPIVAGPSSAPAAAPAVPAGPSAAPAVAGPGGFALAPSTLLPNLADARRAPSQAAAVPKYLEIIKGLVDSGTGVMADGSVGVLPGAAGAKMALKQAESTGETLGKNLQLVDPATGRVYNIPGAVVAAAQKAGAIKGAESMAEVPAANAKTRFQTDEEIRKAGPISQATLPADLTKQTNQADLTARNDKGIAFTPQGAVEIPNYQAIQQGDQRFKTDEEIRKAKGVPQDVGPGVVRIVPDGKGGVTELYKSPFPAPGTPENEQNRLRGKTAGEMYDEAVKGGKAALEQNALLGTQLEQLDQGLSTGSAFDTRRAISNLIATMGGDPEKAGLMDPTKAAQFNTISRELLVNRAKAFGANPSNAEDRYLLQSIDTSNDPAAAAKALIQWRMGRNNALAQYGAGMHEAVDIKGQHPVSYAYDFARKNPGFTQPNPPGAAAEQPPLPNARKAPDGNWYVPDPARPGKYLQVK